MIASCLAEGESGASKTLGENAASQTVAGTATDNAGNTAHDSATGLLVDLSDPNIDCPAPFTVTVGTTMTPSVDVTDEISGVAKKTVGAMATEHVGANFFRADASDNAGRTAEKFCLYSVVYPFDGFAAPRGPHQAGSTINVHFGLGGDRGLEIFRPG